MAFLRQTPRLAADVRSIALTTPISRVALANIFVPGLVVVGAVSGVVAYVRSQLRKESDTMNRLFSQQNTPEVRQRRNERLLVDTEGDPKKTLYNILNW